MSRYDDVCGEGTRWGCRRSVGDGERGHLLRAARSGGYPQGRDVVFHLECCPCVTDPQAVRPLSAESETTPRPSGRGREDQPRLGAASERQAS